MHRRVNASAGPRPTRLVPRQSITPSCPSGRRPGSAWRCKRGCVAPNLFPVSVAAGGVPPEPPRRRPGVSVAGKCTFYWLLTGRRRRVRGYSRRVLIRPCRHAVATARLHGRAGARAPAGDRNGRDHGRRVCRAGVAGFPASFASLDARPAVRRPARSLWARIHARQAGGGPPDPPRVSAPVPLAGVPARQPASRPAIRLAPCNAGDARWFPRHRMHALARGLRPLARPRLIAPA